MKTLKKNVSVNDNASNQACSKGEDTMYSIIVNDTMFQVKTLTSRSLYKLLRDNGFLPSDSVGRTSSDLLEDGTILVKYRDMEVLVEPAPTDISIKEEDIMHEVPMEEQFTDSDSGSVLLVSGLYNLDTDEQIERKLKADYDRINDYCADIEDFEALEAEAVAYFKDPSNKVRVPFCTSIEGPNRSERYEIPETVTGFVGIFDGYRHDSKGRLEPFFKSTGDRVVLEADMLLDPKEIERALAAAGYPYSEMISLTIYGNAVAKYFGTHRYEEQIERKYKLYPLSFGEVDRAPKDRKKLITPYPEHSTIRVAMPGYEVEVSGEYNHTQTDDFGLLMSHHVLDEIASVEISERYALERDLALVSKLEASRVAKSIAFGQHFKDAASCIKSLNDNTRKFITFNELVSTGSSHLISQILYLARKKDMKIKDRGLYKQLQSVQKMKIYETISNDSEYQFAIDTIGAINAGQDVDIESLSNDDITKIFNIIWGKSGIRINVKYKETYFQLKLAYEKIKAGKSAFKTDVVRVKSGATA
jgi:hypothetical protein